MRLHLCAAEAIAYVESGRAVGKVVVRVAD